MDVFLNDLKYACRTLLKSPGFTVLALVALSLGIAINTAIFTVVNSVLIQPLPYSDPARIYMLWEKSPQMESSVAYPNFLDWRSQNRVFERLVAFRRDNLNLTNLGEPERLSVRMISADFFRLLGVAASAGRDFRNEEDRPGAEPVVMLSYEFWKSRFGLDSNIIGKPLVLDERSYTIVGIASKEFQFGTGTDLFVPIGQFHTDRWERGNHPGIYVLGRLKKGISSSQMDSEMQSIAAALGEQYPETNKERSIVIQSLRESVVGDIRPALLLLTGAVALVLLIACANVANMMLARTTERFHEIAIRSALGASQSRIIRQVLTESLLLTSVASIAGIIIAYWGIDLLLLLRPDTLPRLNEIELNSHALIFTAGVTIFTALLFGSLPAWKASKPDVGEALKTALSKQSMGVRQKRVRHALVASEVGLALVLLIAAGLLLKSFAGTQSVNPGFNPENVLTLSISLPQDKYKDAKGRYFFEELEQRVRALPGIKNFAYSNGIPIRGASEELLMIEGRPHPRSFNELPQAVLYVVSPGYFRTLGITLKKGRYLTEQDNESSPVVCVVDERLAEQHFQETEVIGKRVSLGHGAPFMTIVGVVSHVMHYGIDSAGPIQSQIYFPFKQVPPEFIGFLTEGMTLMVKGDDRALDLASTIRNEVRAIDPNQPVYEVQTMDRWVSDSLSARRFAVTLITVFAGMALVLALVGLYAVVSYSVAQRTREIGIRVALGAGNSDILKMIVKQGMIPVTAGLFVGIIGAIASSQVISGMLFQTAPRDPVTFTVIPLMMLAVAVLASYIPARRALQVDPNTALRYE